MKIKYAFKMAFNHPLKYINFVFTYGILIILGIAFLSVDSIVVESNKLKAVEKYHSFDMKMSLSPNSAVRFFDTSLYKSLDDETFTNNFSQLAEFFEISLENAGIKVDVFSSNDKNLSAILGYDISVPEGEVLISKRLKEVNLSENFFYLTINGKLNLYHYTVLDDPFLADNSIYINKTDLLNHLGLNLGPYADFYANSTYFKFSDNSKYNAETLEIKLIDLYDEKNIHVSLQECVDLTEISEAGKGIIGTIKVIFLVVFITLVAILNSIITKLILNYSHDMFVLDYLGAKKRFFGFVWINWFLIHYIPSFLLSFLIGPWVLTIFGKAFYYKYSYSPNFLYWFISFFSVAIVFLGLLLGKYVYRLIRNKGSYRINNERVNLVQSLICFIILLVFSSVLYIFDNPILATINIALLISTGIILIKIIYSIYHKIFGKRNTFKLFNLTLSSKNKTYQANLALIMLIFAVFISLFSIRTSLKNMFRTEFERFNRRCLITNISGDYHASSSDIEIGLVENATINKAFRLNYLFSLNPNKIKNVYDLNFDASGLKKNQIILSENFKYTAGVNINDKISVSIDGKIYELNVYRFIKGTCVGIGFVSDDSPIVAPKGYALNSFPKNSGNAMYSMINLDNVITDYEYNSKGVFDFVTVFCVIVTCSLIIILLENMSTFFQEIKNYYLLVYKLGISLQRIRINLLFEFLLSLITISLISFLVAVLIINRSQYMAGIFKVFFVFGGFTGSNILLSFGLGALCLFLTFLFLERMITTKIYKNASIFCNFI